MLRDLATSDSSTEDFPQKSQKQQTFVDAYFQDDMVLKEGARASAVAKANAGKAYKPDQKVTLTVEVLDISIGDTFEPYNRDMTIWNTLRILYGFLRVNKYLDKDTAIHVFKELKNGDDAIKAGPAQGVAMQFAPK